MGLADAGPRTLRELCWMADGFCKSRGAGGVAPTGPCGGVRSDRTVANQCGLTIPLRAANLKAGILERAFATGRK